MLCARRFPLKQGHLLTTSKMLALAKTQQTIVLCGVIHPFVTNLREQQKQYLFESCSGVAREQQLFRIILRGINLSLKVQNARAFGAREYLMYFFVHVCFLVHTFRLSEFVTYFVCVVIHWQRAQNYPNRTLCACCALVLHIMQANRPDNAFSKSCCHFGNQISDQIPVIKKHAHVEIQKDQIFTRSRPRYSRLTVWAFWSFVIQGTDTVLSCIWTLEWYALLVLLLTCHVHVGTPRFVSRTALLSSNASEQRSCSFSSEQYSLCSHNIFCVSSIAKSRWNLKDINQCGTWKPVICPCQGTQTFTAMHTPEYLLPDQGNVLYVSREIIHTNSVTKQCESFSSVFFTSQYSLTEHNNPPISNVCYEWLTHHSQYCSRNMLVFCAPWIIIVCLWNTSRTWRAEWSKFGVTLHWTLREARCVVTQRTDMGGCFSRTLLTHGRKEVFTWKRLGERANVLTKTANVNHRAGELRLLSLGLLVAMIEQTRVRKPVHNKKIENHSQMCYAVNYETRGGVWQSGTYSTPF